MKKILTGALLAFALLIPAFSFAESTILTDQFVQDTQTDCVDLHYNLAYRSRDIQTNNEVSLLQDFLISNGYLSGESTGYFGVATRAAVKKFQTVLGIISTGNVGPLTRSKIKAVTCTGSTTVAPTTNTVRQTPVPTPVAVPASVTVNVQTPTAPTVDLQADGKDGPITIPYGTSSMLSWTSSNATHCSGSRSGLSGTWGGPLSSTSGAQGTGNLTSSNTFTISCQNLSDGSGAVATDRVTVNVAGL